MPSPTHAGVVAVEPYRRGLAYNQRIAADERQSARGWRDAITASPDGAITVYLVGPDDQPIRGVRVTGTIGRPATAAHDRALTLVAQASGLHTGTTGVLQPGAWIVTIEAHAAPTDAEPIYRARRRLWLKP